MAICVPFLDIFGYSFKCFNGGLTCNSCHEYIQFCIRSLLRFRQLYCADTLTAPTHIPYPTAHRRSTAKRPQNTLKNAPSDKKKVRMAQNCAKNDVKPNPATSAYKSRKKKLCQTTFSSRIDLVDLLIVNMHIMPLLTRGSDIVLGHPLT